MNPLLVASTLTAGVGALLLYKRKKSTGMKGDDAKVGDQVWIATAQLPPNALPPALPPGVGYVIMTVQAVTPTDLQGPLTGYALQNNLVTSLPIPVGPVQVPKTIVSAVYRGGKQVS